MTQTAAEKALAAYDALYKIPNEDRYIIDGDEAQVAADLAAVVRALPEHPFLPDYPFTPTRIIESRRAGGTIFVQLAGTDEEQLALVDSIREELELKILGGDAAVVNAAVEAVQQHTKPLVVHLEADTYEEMMALLEQQTHSVAVDATDALIEKRLQR